jgi:hypothetical protein
VFEVNRPVVEAAAAQKVRLPGFRIIRDEPVNERAVLGRIRGQKRQRHLLDVEADFGPVVRRTDEVIVLRSALRDLLNLGSGERRNRKPA